MAIAHATFSIRDAKGRVSRLIYHADTADFDNDNMTLANLETYFREVSKRLDALLLGVIVGIDISVSITPDVSVKSIPLSTSDVEEKAFFVFPAVGGSGYFAHSVPTFNHSKFPAGGDQMAWDFDADVTYYAPLLFNPGIALDWGAGGGISDNRGVMVTGAPLIYKKFTRSRR